MKTGKTYISSKQYLHANKGSDDWNIKAKSKNGLGMRLRLFLKQSWSDYFFKRTDIGSFKIKWKLTSCERIFYSEDKTPTVSVNYFHISGRGDFTKYFNSLLLRNPK